MNLFPRASSKRQRALSVAGELYVVGSGNFALEVIEFAYAAGFEVEALVEPIDSSRVGGTAHGFDVLAMAPPPVADAKFVVAVGSGRAAIAAELTASGWVAASVVHPSAVISESARLGEGVVVGPLVVVGAATEVGSHSLLGRGVLVGHHTTLGSGTVVNPGGNIAGLVTGGSELTVGMGASVANGLSLGDRAVIAAGAVVVRDVDAGSRVQGVPARVFLTVSRDGQ